MKSLGLYLAFTFFVLSPDLRNFPISPSYIGLFYIFFILMLTGLQKIPVFLVNAVFLSVAVIAYALIFDLAQGVNAKYDLRHIINLSIVLSSLMIGYATTQILRTYDRDMVVSKLFGVYVAIFLLNSIIIIFQVFDPGFRAIVEGIIAESTRTDYLEGIRYRGLANAGGAALSISTAFATVVAINLAKHNVINWSAALATGLINAFAMIFIGRTGFLVLMAYLIYEAIMNIKIKKLLTILIVAPLFLLLFSTLVDFAVIHNTISVENYRHAFGILLNMNEFGLDGAVENEGTVQYVLSMFALPESVWKLLFGIGNFSGGYLWDYPGDPGVMKVLTLLGLPVAVIVYLLILHITFNVANASIKYKMLILFIGLMLLILEVKEPFLFKGSSAKLFWVVVGIYLSNMRSSRDVFL